VKRVSILLIILLVGIFSIANVPAYADSLANDIIEQFEKDLITEEEFEQKLRELHYDELAIRQAKALIGKLEHQQAGYVPEQQEPKVHVKTDLADTNIHPDLVMSEGETSTSTSSDSGQNLVFVLIIGSISLAVAVFLAFFKKAIFVT